MPTCAHCGERWRYMETIKATWQMKPKCPYCHQGNYHSAKARKKSMFFAVVFAPFLIIIGSMLTSLFWIIPIAIVVFIALCSTYPLMIETSKEEEPLW